MKFTVSLAIVLLLAVISTGISQAAIIGSVNPLILSTGSLTDTDVTIYPAPEGVELSNDYKVTVNGHPLDIYTSPIWAPEYAPSFGGPYSYAYFDLTGKAQVSITTDKPLDKLAIRPQSLGIKPTVKGKTLTFDLTSPCRFSVEPDGKAGPLLLFVNPPQAQKPDPNDPDVRYFGPGLHKAGAINLTSGQTLFLDGGAVVVGGIHATGENIRICGRGILDGLSYERFKGPTWSPIMLDNCQHVNIEGIILKDSWSWTCHVRASRDVAIDNLKIVSTRCENNDGIDITNSSDVTVRNCFIRSDDDCIAVKGMTAERQPCENISVTDSVLWTDRANIFRLGCESRAEGMRNFHFRNIDIPHYCTAWINVAPNIGAPLCITVQPAEDMAMENVLFENIRIHDELQRPISSSDYLQNYLIEIRPLPTQWAKKKTPGTARNIIFRNIIVTGKGEQKPPQIVIEQADGDHPVENIIFDNVRCFTKPVTENSPQLHILSDHGPLLFRYTLLD